MKNFFKGLFRRSEDQNANTENPQDNLPDVREVLKSPGASNKVGFKHFMLWLTFYAIMVTLAIVIVSFSKKWYGILPSVITIIVVVAYAYTVVSQTNELILEIFGVYIGHPLVADIYFFFPFFERQESLPNLKEQILELNFRNESNNGTTGGDIEFLDGSSAIKSYFYFRVYDSMAVTYHVENGKLLFFLREKVEGALRSFLAGFTIDEAIALRSQFTLEAIINDGFVKRNENDGSIAKEEDGSIKIYYDPKDDNEFNKAMRDWGVVATKLAVSDVDLPKEIKEQRERKLEAEKSLEVSKIKQKEAEIEKETAKIVAKGERKARVQQGKGEKEYNVLVGAGQLERTKNLIQAGIPASHISNIYIAEKKWDAFGKSKSTDKLLVMDNVPGNSAASGANFGAGMAMSNEQTSVKEDDKKVQDKKEEGKKKDDEPGD